MSTSGITIKEMTRDEIINAALRKIGVVGEGVTANATQLSEGAEALNNIIQSFQTLGMPLWKRTELAIPMQAAKRTYTIGVGQEIDEPFPLKISEATVQVSGSDSQIDAEIKASYDFNLLPTGSTGTPVTIKYQPFINFGVVTVWPTPLDASSTLTITYQEPYDVATAGTQTLDFPQEWQLALIYNTAMVLSDDYGLPIPDKQWIEKQAEKHLNTALSFGTEQTSLFIQPQDRGE